MNSTDRWTWVDAVTWTCQLNERAAFQAWLSTHPSVSKDYIAKFGDRPSSSDLKACQQWELNHKVFAVGYYQLDKDIPAFWRSPLGQFINACYQVNTTIGDFFRYPRRKVRCWLWWLSWRWRCSLVNIGYALATQETALERTERRLSRETDNE